MITAASNEAFAGCRPEVVIQHVAVGDLHRRVVDRRLDVGHIKKPFGLIEGRAEPPAGTLIPLPVVRKIVRNNRLGGLLHEYARAA